MAEKKQNRRRFLNELAATSCGVLVFNRGVASGSEKNGFVLDECPALNHPPFPADYMVFDHGNIGEMVPAHVQVLMREVIKAQKMFAADMIISNLNSLKNIHHGFQVNQLEHSLQVATRAYKDNASDEWIFAALCHDSAKTVSILNHDAVAAENLRPYVSDETYNVIKNHQVFEGRFYYPAVYKVLKTEEWNPDQYKRFSSESWFQKAMEFTENWDAPSFEIGYPTKPLKDFEDLIRKMALRPLP